MARRKLIAGNWKMNGLQADGGALATGVAAKVKAASPTRYDMAICPPFTLLPAVITAVAGSGIGVGGQDCHTAESVAAGWNAWRVDGMSEGSERRGSCLCGAVRMAIRASGTSIGACHCTMCRKWGGGPLLAVECGSNVQFAGSEFVTVYGSSQWAERGFCAKCGTHLFYRLKKEGHYAVPVGLLDGEDWVLDQQIFIDEKPPYYTLANETKTMTGAEVFAQFSALLG